MLSELWSVAKEETARTLRGYFVPIIAVWRLFDRTHAEIEKRHHHA